MPADLNSFHLGELEETTGTLSALLGGFCKWRYTNPELTLRLTLTLTPPYYVDEDYLAGPEINEPLPEGSNWHGSESPSLEIDAYVWCYALIVLLARNELMNVIQGWSKNLGVLGFWKPLNASAVHMLSSSSSASSFITHRSSTEYKCKNIKLT